MRLLVGTDDQNRFETALRLLLRLDFQDPEWHFAHVVSAIDPSPTSDVHKGQEAITLLKESFGDSPETLSLLNEITVGLNGNVHLLQGAQADSLMRLSETLRADIVGLGSSGHSTLGATLLGSVGRAFAIGSPSSFLIGRGNVIATGKLRIVFATDHSEYARNALKMFLAMKPKGIESMVLMTASEMLETSEIVEYMNLVQEAAMENRSLREHITILGEQSIAFCKEAGISAIAEQRDGFVSSAIDQAVGEHEADLVVLGAQGHGFLERLLIGSTALSQVVTSRHSTLIIRAR